MHLTDEENFILDGNKGEAARLAMSILTDLGELFGAESMMPVSQVHIDTTLYMVDAGLEFAEKLARLGARVNVPTSLNPSAIDLVRWKDMKVPPAIFPKHQRLAEAYLKMQATPTWTCAPYQQGIIPRFGEQIAWGESNAIAFANSVIGARTNRYADLMDICAAIVGKVPKFGLHLTRNRVAKVLIELEGFTSSMFQNSIDHVFHRVAAIACGLGVIDRDLFCFIENLWQHKMIHPANTGNPVPDTGRYAGAENSNNIFVIHSHIILPRQNLGRNRLTGFIPKTVYR